MTGVTLPSAALLDRDPGCSRSFKRPHKSRMGTVKPRQQHSVWLAAAVAPAGAPLL